MIENRLVWLEAVLKSEGGYVNHPLDKGGPTNCGITMRTLSDWRGEECNIEDVTGLTEQEASDIYMSRFWQVMRGDQLPSGVDLYACDFAVNSGPGRAAKILQGLVDTKADSFVGPKTIEAVRKQDPLKLLLDLHGARMEFLMDLSTWDAFGRGWTNRCTKMLTLARSKVSARPGMAEAVGSKIISTGGPITAGSTIGLGVLLQQYGPQVLEWLNEPANIEKLQGGVVYITDHGNLPTVIAALSGLLALTTSCLGAAVFWRWRMFKKGEV
jgi:lysozyme family protein